MHIDDLPKTGQNDIWRPGKVAPVEPVSVPESMNHSAHYKFGCGVFGFDRRHDAGLISVSASSISVASEYPNCVVTVLVAQVVAIKVDRDLVRTAWAETVPVFTRRCEVASAQFAVVREFILARLASGLRGERFVDVWHALVPLKHLDCGCRANTPRGNKKAPPIVNEIEVSTRISSGNGLQEYGPSVWPALDLYIGRLAYGVLVRTQHDHRSVGRPYQYRDTRTSELGLYTGLELR
jgi:hypothetical protein